MDEARRRALNDAMARLADGDRSAIDAVYAGLFPPVRDFCASFLGGGPDAEDAAQEALLALFAKASSYERGRDVLAWALTIAAWECRTVRRRRQRRRTTAMTSAETHAADGASPEEAAIERDLARAFEAAVGALDEKDRAVLAQVLEESGSGATFRKRKERMLDRLREGLRRLHGHS